MVYNLEDQLLEAFVSNRGLWGKELKSVNQIRHVRFNPKPKSVSRGPAHSEVVSRPFQAFSTLL